MRRKKKNVFMGIDPGKSGAAAIITASNQIEIFDFFLNSYFFNLNLFYLLFSLGLIKKIQKKSQKNQGFKRRK
mgnify:CR=1 FL=1